MSITMTKRAPLTFKPDSVTPQPSTDKATPLPSNAKTRKQAKKREKPSREGRRFIAGHVIEEAHKQFSILAIQQGKDVQELLVEAINDCFAKYGLSRIA
jgi:hypothetical protein